MKTMRARLLMLLVLAALVSAPVGVSPSWAGGHRASRGAPPIVVLPRRAAGPMSGEPDSGGNSAPRPGVQPAYTVVGVNPWLLQLWYQWWLEQQAKVGEHN